MENMEFLRAMKEMMDANRKADCEALKEMIDANMKSNQEDLLARL
jgi:hypothetical protein